MKKKYDYHSGVNYRSLLFGLCFGTGGLGTVVVFIEPSLTGKIIFLLLSTACFALPFPAYYSLARTYIEVTEDGILFHGWRKKIFSTWRQVREIKTLTPIKGNLRYKVFTDKGNFIIGSGLEPADQEAATIFDLIRRGSAKYQIELIAEITNRTPGLRTSYAMLIRPTESSMADRALKAIAVILLLATCCLIAYSVWDNFFR
ncbi:MAG: hypothetical protein OEW15_05915 [Nitrospirota bacterium]|nr:hypothetical protein [Nitrospirota bacterium]